MNSKKITCEHCGKKTAYYSTFYRKELCIKCDLELRQLRLIRTEGNKMLKNLIKEINEERGA